MSKLDFISKEIAVLRRKNLYRKLTTVDGPQGPHVVINGKKVILFCSNDYLSLAGHPKVKETAKNAIDNYGLGAAASRLVSGNMVLHTELEEKIAEFKGTEAAIIFNSGYAANSGSIPALVGSSDFIFSDRLNHASIIDGCRLSRAKLERYKHSDMDSLAKFLAKNGKIASKTPKKLIVTDGVFSMDGDIAPLREISALAEKHDALLMVDDAHGTGVLGENGQGSAEHLGVDTNRIDIHMGTFGKAFGSFGAYIAGKRDVIDYLVNKSRNFIFSTSLPPAVAAASIAAIDIITSEPERRVKLKKSSDFLRSGLKDLGFNTLNSDTQIIPVLTGCPKKAIEMMKLLLDKNIFAQAIRPPAVPEGESRIRITVTYGHSRSDLERALESFKKVGKEVGII